MDTEKLWSLFFATGLPQAYLAIQGQRKEEERGVCTAFRPADQGRKKG